MPETTEMQVNRPYIDGNISMVWVRHLGSPKRRIEPIGDRSGICTFFVFVDTQLGNEDILKDAC